MSQNGRPTLNRKDFRKIRERLGYSLDGWAIELGYEGTSRGNRTTIKRLENGERPIPMPVAKLAWFMGQVGVPMWPVELTAAPARDDIKAVYDEYVESTVAAVKGD